MKNKYIFFLAFAVLLITTSCNPFRELFKFKEVNKASLEIKTDSNFASNEKVVDKTITTIITEEKGTKVIPKKQTTVKVDVDKILRGETLSIDSGWFRMVQAFDSTTRTLNTYIERPQDTISTDRITTTTELSDVLTERESTAKITTQIDQETKDKVSTKEVKPKNTLWYVVAFFGFLAVIYFFLRK